LLHLHRPQLPEPATARQIGVESSEGFGSDGGGEHGDITLLRATHAPVVNPAGIDFLLDDLVHPLARAVSRQRAFSAAAHHTKSKSTMAKRATQAFRIGTVRPFVTSE
jgi:hypothetical protein